MNEPTSPKRAGEDNDQTAAQASFKRRRTALACNSCRTRKTRCNGERPNCVPCIELGLECVYENPANGNAKPQQSTYDDRLKSIEDTLRLLAQSREPSFPTASQQATARNYTYPVTAHHVDGQRVATLQDGEPYAEADDEDAIDGMASITDPGDSRTRFYGPSSNISFLRHLSTATVVTLKSIDNHLLALDQQTGRPLISRVPSPANTPSTCGPMERIPVDVLALPSESQAAGLLNLFFNETGMLFPFIQQNYVLMGYNFAKTRGFAGMRKSFLCLLNAIFAIAANLDEDPEMNPHDAEIFYQRGNAVLSQIEPRMNNVETVQSLLLMIQYRQGTQKSDDTFVLLGKAVRIALQLGLHSKPDSAELSPVDVEVRKRVWYNCIILDRVLSMTFGRPQTISAEYIRLDLPLDRDLDSLAVSDHGVAPQVSDDAHSTVCFFTATIKLYDVLNYTLATIYDHNVSIETGVPLAEILKNGLCIEQKLIRWQAGLPSKLKLRPWQDSPQQLFNGGFDPVFDKLSAIIHLRYLNVSLLHHRAILDRFLDSLNATGHQQASSHVQDLFFLDFARHSLQVSQNSAMEIVDVVWRMSHRPGALGAWWFSLYYCFNACLVMYGCCLIHFSLSRKDYCQLDTAAQSVRQQKILSMIASLNTGVKAVERVGKGTRTAKGIRRTLIKIIQISTRLAQLHGQDDSLGGQAITFVHANDQQTNGVQQGAVQPDEEQLGIIKADSWQGQIAPDLQFWTAQDDFDIFADLGSLDARLGNFMAA